MGKTRIAVAGAGYIGLAHIGVARASERCELTAIVDPSPAARAHAEAAGVPLYPSLAELLRKDRPDGVVLATPNQLHLPHALECIAAGMPILLEKPIAPTVAEARRVVECRRARRRQESSSATTAHTARSWPRRARWSLRVCSAGWSR